MHVQKNKTGDAFVDLNPISLQTKALPFSDFLSSLTPQQKKIILIASVAFACIVALFLYCKCCFKGVIQDVKKDDKEGGAKVQQGDKTAITHVNDKVNVEDKQKVVVDAKKPVDQEGDKKLKEVNHSTEEAKENQEIVEKEIAAKKLQEAAADKKFSDEATQKLPLKTEEKLVEEHNSVEEKKRLEGIKLLQEDAAKLLPEEESATKVKEKAAAAKKLQDEVEAELTAKKRQREEAATKLLDDEAAKKVQEDAVKKLPPKTPLEIEAESDPIKIQLLKDFSPQMVEALGGWEKMKTFPVIYFTDTIDLDDLTAPVMIGEPGKPILVFCYYIKNTFNDPYLKKPSTGKYELKWEYICREPQGWKPADNVHCPLHLNDPNRITEGSLGEKHMLDRIRRLMNGEAVGCLHRYEGYLLNKPDDVEKIRPKNSYLKGDEMTAYMKEAGTLWYERELEEKTTDLYLWDPSKDRTQQNLEFVAKFPNVIEKKPSS